MTNKLRLLSGFILVFLILAGIGCKKKDTTPPAPTATDVKFLGHKGAGSNNYEDAYMEMTTPSFVEALKTMDGVEIDAQMSLDGTVWMIHDSYISNCCSWPTTYTPALYDLHDSQIANIQLCADGRHDRLYKLSELIALWNSTQGGFTMDIEIKQADLCQDTINNIGGMSAYLSKMADEIDTLFTVRNNPNTQIMFEVDDTTFCRKLRNSYPGFKFCIFRYGFNSLYDYADTAIALGYDGVSENFSHSYVTAASVKAARDRGLIVQLWTPYTQAELTTAFNMDPNFIQSDNTNAKSDLNVQ